MSGSSINSWSWLARPNARIEDGLIIDGDKVESYFPGERQKELLNAIQKISDEQNALEFVRQWGVLGLRQNASKVYDHRSQITGAFVFTLAARKKENPDIDKDSVMREVLEFFNPGGGFNLTPKGEPVSGMLHFAQKIRHLSEVKRLIGLYKEDEIAAAYDAKEWIGNLSPEWYGILVGPDIEILQKQYGPGYSEPGFYKYVLGIIFHGAQQRVSGRYQRGVWVQLYNSPFAGRPQGFPVIQFDGLFRFIEYILLVDSGPSPKQCADPKCRQLFFPTKADQEYCPPPPGVKRSRCENRHGQWLRRHRIKAVKLHAEGKPIKEIANIIGTSENQINEWVKGV